MATIDQLDLSVYNMYAARTKMIEHTNQQYRLSEASSIPPQIQVIDIYPRLSELDLLLGIIPKNVPWAYFFPPPHFQSLRRSPFAFYRVIPSFGDEEKQEQNEEALEEYECESQEEEEERKILMRCLKEVGKINDWMGFIVGRMGQFLQG